MPETRDPDLPSRRSEDTRIDALVTAVSNLSTNTALSAQAITHLTSKVEDVGKDVERVVDQVSRGQSDATATPAGRDLLRRSVANENRLDEHEEKLEALDNWKNTVSAELRTTWRLMRGLAAFVSLLAAALGAVWTLHLLGAI